MRRWLISETGRTGPAFTEAEAVNGVEVVSLADLEEGLLSDAAYYALGDRIGHATAARVQDFLKERLEA